jgi:hypothetical protein
MVQVTQEYWLAKVQELREQLELEKSRSSYLRLELDSAQLRVVDSEMELHRLKQSQSLKETELAMELEKVRAQVWVQRE